LLDKVDPSRYADERWQAVFDKLNDLVGTFGEDDLTDWIFTFQSDTDYSLERAIQKWEEKHSLPWLIALLSKINGDHPMADDLLGEAKKIGKNSPAYTTISFHIIRLLTEKGEYDEAKQKLDLIISEKSQTMPLSSHNLFLAQRMKLADNLGEFVRYAIRNPVGISDGTQMRTSYNDEEKPENFKQRMMFDCDSVKVMNEKMPISVLKTIVESKYLPDNLRKEMAIAVWVKAILLDDEKTSTDIIPTLNELAPELKEYLDAFFSAESREAKKFSAVYTILKFPGMYPYIGSKLLRNTPMDKIDGYRDNWWGVFNQDEEDTSDRGYYFSRTMIVEPLWMLYPEGEVDFPSFLSNRQKDLANIEWIKFVKTDAAPNYLSAIVIDWAEKHPEDPRVSEALHLAVRSTRYGNTNDKSSSFSKRAFQILHKKYPDSEWAKKTKYWY